jgi:hypothetical protein
MRYRVSAGVLMLLVLLAACAFPTGKQTVALPRATATPTGLRSIQGVDFELTYPPEWKPFYQLFIHTPNPTYNSEFKADELVSLGLTTDQGQGILAYCKLLEKKYDGGQTLADAMELAYVTVHQNYEKYEAPLGAIQVNGADGIEKIYQRPWGEPWYKIRDVWFDRGDHAVILSCWSYPDRYDDNLKEFQTLLEGLELK